MHKKYYIVLILLSTSFIFTSCSQKEKYFDDGIAEVNKLIDQGLGSDAIERAKKLVEQSKSDFGEKHENTAIAMFELQNLYPASEDKTIELLREIVRIYSEQYGDNSHQAAFAHYSLATNFDLRDNTSDALTHYKFAWDNFNPVQAPQNFLQSGFDIARIYAGRLHFQDALRISRETLAKAKENDLDFCGTTANLHGLILRTEYDMGDCPSALKTAKEILEKQKQYNQENKLVQAETHNFMGNCHYVMEQYQKALEEYRHSLQIKQNALGKSNFQMLATLNIIRSAQDHIGQPKKVDATISQMVSILEKNTKEPDSQRLDYYLQFAQWYKNKWHFLKADAFFKKALKIADNLYKPDNPVVINIQDQYCSFLDMQGKYVAMELFLRQRLSLMKKELAIPNSAIINLHNRLGYLYNQHNRPELSKKYFEKYIDATKNKIKGENAQVVDSLKTIAKMYAAVNATEEAEAIWKRLLPITQSVYGFDDWHVGECLFHLASFPDQDSSKVDLLKRAVEIQEKEWGEFSPLLLTALNGYADALQSDGEQKRAQEIRSRAKEIRNKNHR